jgi:hypothetical protein
MDEQLHPQVLINLRFALGLGHATQRSEVVHLHAIEVVLGLRVDHPEHRVGVALAVHMRDAPIVADHVHVRGFLLPARGLRVVIALKGEGRGGSG